MIILPSRAFEKHSLGKDPRGREVIWLSLPPDRISKLCCNHCGCALRLHSHHARVFRDLVHGREVVYMLPRLQCLNDRCPHHDHSEDHREGATHMVFPSFIAPYEMISSQILGDLARAQAELDKEDCAERCNGPKFRRLEQSRGVFIRLHRRYGDLWLYLREFLNTPAARRYLAYVRRITAQVQACHERACLEHFYSKTTGVIPGRAVHREFVFSSGGYHSLPYLIRFLLSYFAHALATCPWWPPPLFWKTMRPYREI